MIGDEVIGQKLKASFGRWLKCGKLSASLFPIFASDSHVPVMLAGRTFHASFQQRQQGSACRLPNLHAATVGKPVGKLDPDTSASSS